MFDFENFEFIMACIVLVIVNVVPANHINLGQQVGGELSCDIAKYWLILSKLQSNSP